MSSKLFIFIDNCRFLNECQKSFGSYAKEIKTIKLTINSAKNYYKISQLHEISI